MALSAPVITSRKEAEVKDAIDSYEAYHTTHGGDVAARKAKYTDMVNKYYDLATSFYEYGWGTSFHFAHRWANEGHIESLKRHEHYLALRLGLQPGDKVLDVGCGVGGPLREIALFSGAHITGLNNNSYQISRGLYHNNRAGHGITDTCCFVKADFMKMPFEDEAFDAVYEIDATCHAPDQVGCYSEVFRVLKPGARFAGYEWCATDKYDPSNQEHKTIMAEIELGNGLPDVRTTAETIESLKAAGFVVEDFRDMALDADVPWWEPVDPESWRLGNFRTTRLGRKVTHCLVRGLETVGVAPKGSLEVATMLERAADGLVAGGKKGIFTPLYFFVARKPEA
ncbi:cycloartenol-C-24-methyltransferase [Raphidocelis subcapitata]|uniref:Methyltransferase n=1 Tax=Raphidocelis subcapitata TaxID=307507 RepID=A0A2V0P408_9CHLO|nr:cycloartenol-C-24-methyltransferase [Raphidocelis subcapitata]|eukprot:GBF91937.1 cycloartenol-C-24-methyltransferase [Raphidocelis subcapitata]